MIFGGFGIPCISMFRHKRHHPIFRVDNQGVIWEQQGVFRVNCMDCLDRTNVVQAALARYVLETQVW
jgi:hypothetical protein